MQLHIEIDCDNAATLTRRDQSNILMDAAVAITVERYAGKLIDLNGNTVGRWWYSGDELTDTGQR